MTSAPCTTHAPFPISSLKKRGDFLRVQSTGQKWVTPTLIIQMAPSSMTDPTMVRYGLTVTKKIYKKAVDRNRVKRRLRPIIQSVSLDLHLHGVDIVFIARAAALDAPYEALQKDLRWAVKRLIQKDLKNGATLP